MNKLDTIELDTIELDTILSPFANFQVLGPKLAKIVWLLLKAPKSVRLGWGRLKIF